MATAPPSYVIYTGDGTQTQFSFPMQYIQPEDIQVKLNGVTTTAFTFVSSNTISITPAPAAGVQVNIFRNTPAEFVINQFQLGAPFLPNNLAANFEQILFVAQETIDSAELTIGAAEAAAADALATAVAVSDAQEAFELDINAQQTAFEGRALRAPVGESMAAMPAAAARAGKTLIFDGAGAPQVVAASDASSLAAALSDYNDGANLVGYNSTQTVRQALDNKAATAHTHAEADVTGLTAALAGKSNTGHTHTLVNISDAGTAAAQAIGTSGATVPLCGNSSTWDGVQTLAGGVLDARIFLDGGPGRVRDILSSTGGVKRWSFGADGTAETGSNSGTQFVIQGFDDAGAVLGVAFRATRGGAVNIGAPAGGFKGAGTLNAVGVYDDNVLLTCYPLEAYNEGSVDTRYWDSTVAQRVSEGSTEPLVQPRQHTPARRFAERAAELLDPKQYVEAWKANGHLPSMPSPQEWVAAGSSISVGEMVQRLNETADLAAIHIDKLLARIEALEAALAASKLV